MNILNWLRNRSGKMALSALQAAGIATVVGVAGVGAWNFLSSPAEESSYNPSSYNPGEIVYVAGNPNSGKYERISYTSGQGDQVVSESAVRVDPKNIRLLGESARQAQVRDEMEEYEESTRNSVARSTGNTPTAYQGGETEGLGLMSNVANERNALPGADDPMAAMAKTMGNMQGLMSQVQQQAANAEAGAGAGQREGGEKGKEEQPTLGKLQKAKMATAGSGSKGFNSTSVGSHGGNKGGGATSAAEMAQANNVLNSAQEQMGAALEGARLRAKSSFGEDSLGKSRNASVQAGPSLSKSKQMGELAYIAKMSNKVAATKTRAANSGMAPFISNTRISGGLRIESENLVTGQNHSSKDFSNETSAQLRGVQKWATDSDTTQQMEERKKDYDTIRKWTWIAVPLAVMMIPLIGAFATIGRMGIPFVSAVAWGLAAAAAVIALIPNIVLLAKSASFANKYGGAPVSTWGMAISATLSAGVGAAFIPGVSAMLANMKSWLYLTAGPILGLGGAWFANEMTKDAVIENPELENVNVKSGENQ